MQGKIYKASEKPVNMLYVIGLGLGWRNLSLKAVEALQGCSEVYLENYTSVPEFSVGQLERLLGKKVKPLDRKGVEEERLFLKQAHVKDVALLVYGDPLSATTHAEILQEAKKKKLRVKIIHSSSVFTAVAETGLQLYKFGKVASIPLPEPGFEPESFFSILKENQSIQAHTLFLLDLKPDKKTFLSIKQAIELLLKVSKKHKSKLFSSSTLCIGCARLGFESQLIKVGTAKELMKQNFGKPPYCLIVPGKLHFMEEEILKNVR